MSVVIEDHEFHQLRARRVVGGVQIEIWERSSAPGVPAEWRRRPLPTMQLTEPAVRALLDCFAFAPEQEGAPEGDLASANSHRYSRYEAATKRWISNLPACVRCGVERRIVTGDIAEYRIAGKWVRGAPPCVANKTEAA